MHLASEQIAQFLDGRLSEASVASVETHIDACDDCRQLLSEVVRHRRGLTQASLSPTDVLPLQGLPAAPGDVIDGRYRLERVLGVGGMGCVFEATQLALNTRVAVKFMLPALVGDTSAVGRFLREARAVARLKTTHVCRVFDLGTLKNGAPFLVMEYLQGETVEDRLQRLKRFSEQQVQALVVDVLDALEEAHALGVVHRDIKPANLFYSVDAAGVEVVKVLDFGIAKSAHPDIEQGLEATSTRTIVGSPLYMAPEQLEGGAVDGRVDLWALGCVMYQLLEGEPPFRQDSTLVDLMFSIQRRPHRSLTGPLAEVVDRLLEKAPARRYQSTRELRDALEVTPPPRGAAKKPRAARRVVTALSIALLLVVPLFIVWRRQPSPARAETPPPPPTRVAPLEPVEVGAPVAPRVALPVVEEPPPARVPPRPVPSRSPRIVDLLEDRR